MREFEDLEASLDAAAAAALSLELDQEVRDFVEADHATWTIAQRLRVVCRESEPVELHLHGEHRVRGWVTEVGQDHVELSASATRVAIHAVVPLKSIVLALAVPSAAMHSTGVGVSIGSCLRQLQAQSPDVVALMVTGRSLSGKLVAVHRDHCDLSSASGPLALPYSAVSAWLAAG
jgi:hypothetical protein